MDEQGVELVGTVRLLVFEGLTDGLRDFGEFQSCLIGKLSNFWVYDLAFGRCVYQQYCWFWVLENYMHHHIYILCI